MATYEACGRIVNFIPLFEGSQTGTAVYCVRSVGHDGDCNEGGTTQILTVRAGDTLRITTPIITVTEA